MVKALGLDHNKRSVFSLYYHLVIVTKYRRPVITDDILKRLKEMFEQQAPTYKANLLEINHDRDHVHILFKASPNTELSKFINVYNASTSRIIKKEFPDVANQLWNNKFWTSSYFIQSAGGAPLSKIKEYIQNQGENS